MMKKPSNRDLTDRTFFVTCVIEGRKPVFSNGELAKRVLDALQHFRLTKEIWLYGYVIMPDHIHFVAHVMSGMTLPSLVRRVKTFTSRNRDFNWQEGYWSAMIHGREMVNEKLRYMHANPVRAGLVETPEQYPWSSAPEYYLKETSDSLDPY